MPAHMWGYALACGGCEPTSARNIAVSPHGCNNLPPMLPKIAISDGRFTPRRANKKSASPKKTPPIVCRTGTCS